MIQTTNKRLQAFLERTGRATSTMKKPLKVVLIIIAIFFLAAVVSHFANAADYLVQCDPPTEREDGTPLDLNEIREYEWYVNGALSGTSVSCEYLVVAPDGTYEIVARTIDTDGRTSKDSIPKSVTLQTAPPLPPRLR